jgi:hypothetical protein
MRKRRVSEVSKEKDGIQAGTLYKWHCYGKHLELFSKVDSMLFIDLDLLDQLFERGRIVPTLTTRSLQR